MSSEGFLLKLLKVLAPTTEGQKPILNKKLIFDKLKLEYKNLSQNALTPQLFDLLIDLGLIEKYEPTYTEKNKVFRISNMGEIKNITYIFCNPVWFIIYKGYSYSICIKFLYN